MMAIITAMMAFFRAAGFAYGSLKSWQSLFTIMMGVMMSIMALADDRYMGMHLIMLGSAMQLLMYEWLLIMNMQKKAVKLREEKPSEDGFERLR